MSEDNVTLELPSVCDTPIPINNISAEHGQIKPVSHHFKNDGHSHKRMQFSMLEGCTPNLNQTALTKEGALSCVGYSNYTLWPKLASTN